MNWKLKLRLKYLTFAIIASYIACTLAAIFAILDDKYKISRFLDFRIENKFLGDHRFIYPSMSNKIAASCVIFLLLVCGWITCYQLYHKYKYRIESHYAKGFNKKHEDYKNIIIAKITKLNTSEQSLRTHNKLEDAKKIKHLKKNLENFRDHLYSKKRISKKNLLIGCAIILGHNFISFMTDELRIALEKGLNGIDSFFWISYMIIIITVFLTNTLDLFQANAISNKLAFVNKKSQNRNKIEKKPIKTRLKQWVKDNWKFQLSRYGIFGFTSLIAVFSAVVLTALSKKYSWINFNAPEIILGGEKISWFTNQDNMLMLIFMPIFLFSLIYAYILPRLEDHFKNDKLQLDKKDDEKSEKNTQSFFEKGIGKFLYITFLSFLSAASMDISISVANSMQEISNPHNSSYIVCILILLVVNALTAYSFIKQYITDEPKNVVQLENNYNKLITTTNEALGVA